jgi:hypothetical protein
MIDGPTDPRKIHKLDRIYSPQDRSYKLLGVLLDENLSFYQHCNHVCNKIAQSNYIITKSKHLLPKETLRTLYFALLHPPLLYCLPLYSCTAAKNINILAIMQKKTIRAFCKASYNDHTSNMWIFYP